MFKKLKHMYRLSREATRVLCENLKEWNQSGVPSITISKIPGIESEYLFLFIYFITWN